MKKLFLITALFIGSGTVYTANAQKKYGFVGFQPSTTLSINNGIYKASVNYYSYTGHQAEYTLKVKVESNRVVAIYFEDDGYLHKNSDSYYFKGGTLFPIRDYEGKIVAAEGEVIITDLENRSTKFEIVIQ